MLWSPQWPYHPGQKISQADLCSWLAVTRGAGRSSQRPGEGWRTFPVLQSWKWPSCCKFIVHSGILIKPQQCHSFRTLPIFMPGLPVCFPSPPSKSKRLLAEGRPQAWTANPGWHQGVGAQGLSRKDDCTAACVLRSLLYFTIVPQPSPFLSRWILNGSLAFCVQNKKGNEEKSLYFWRPRFLLMLRSFWQQFRGNGYFLLASWWPHGASCPTLSGRGGCPHLPPWKPKVSVEKMHLLQ